MTLNQSVLLYVCGQKYQECLELTTLAPPIDHQCYWTQNSLPHPLQAVIKRSKSSPFWSVLTTLKCTGPILRSSSSESSLVGSSFVTLNIYEHKGMRICPNVKRNSLLRKNTRTSIFPLFSLFAYTITRGSVHLTRINCCRCHCRCRCCCTSIYRFNQCQTWQTQRQSPISNLFSFDLIRSIEVVFCLKMGAISSIIFVISSFL